jgi:subfamily B ATP-binding cassette protein MsbA
VNSVPNLSGSGVTTARNLVLYRRLLRFAWRYKWAFLVAVVGMVLLSATTTGFSVLMRPLLDEGFVNRDPTMIQYTPPLIIGLFLVRGVASFMSDYTIAWVSRRVIFDIRGAAFSRLLRLPNSFYDINASGNLISKLIFDVEQIASAVTQAVFTVFRDGLTVVALFVWMAYLNWKLTLLFIVIAPATTLIIRAMSRRFRKTSWSIQQSMGEIAEITQEAAEGQRIVKAFGGQQHEQDVFHAANERNRRQYMRKAAVSSIGMSLIQFLAAFALALVIYFALASGNITAGSFVSYISAIALMMGPSKRLTKVNEVIQTGLAAAQSAFALLDEEMEVDTGTVELQEIQGRIRYRNVGFRYPASTTDAVRDITFSIEPGQTLALVGASGSGKTTLVNLLPRFYVVGHGAIFLDDVNINELKLANLRSHIAVVGQETLLFDDSIRNNIAYGQEHAIDEARLRGAVETAYISEFVDKLPDGLDTRVGEKGLRLSGGQRQRIAIARALYKNAPVLILDEATSALDSESERFVQKAMEKLMQNRTTLVIAHRLSTVERADRIVVLQHGGIIETGTHAELIARNGVYAGLYRKQFHDDES